MTKKMLSLTLIGGCMLAGLQTDAYGKVDTLKTIGGSMTLIVGFCGMIYSTVIMPESAEEKAARDAMRVTDEARKTGKLTMGDKTITDAKSIACLSRLTLKEHFKARLSRCGMALLAIGVAAGGGYFLQVGLREK